MQNFGTLFHESDSKMPCDCALKSKEQSCPAASSLAQSFYLDFPEKFISAGNTCHAADAGKMQICLQTISNVEVQSKEQRQACCPSEGPDEQANISSCTPSQVANFKVS